MRERRGTRGAPGVGRSGRCQVPGLAFASACALAVACGSARVDAPDPSLGPVDVVRLQLEALRSGDGDAGIVQAFRFASPANKRATGPIERFIRIVRAPDYVVMLRHRRASFGPGVVDGSHASQLVTITARDGSRHRFLFELSRQPDGPLADCWLTDAVVRVDAAESDAIEI